MSKAHCLKIDPNFFLSKIINKIYPVWRTRLNINLPRALVTVTGVRNHLQIYLINIIKFEYPPRKRHYPHVYYATVRNRNENQSNSAIPQSRIDPIEWTVTNTCVHLSEINN